MTTDTDLAPADRFLRRLYGASRGGGTTIGALRRWQPSQSAPDVIALTRDASGPVWPFFATVGAAIVTHGDYSGGWDGIGQTLRRCGRAGSTGPNDRTVTARMDNLAAADTHADLHAALKSAVRTAARSNRAPNWRQLLDDLTDWSDPALRDEVRTRWLRGFYEYQPANTTTKTTA